MQAELDELAHASEVLELVNPQDQVMKDLAESTPFAEGVNDQVEVREIFFDDIDFAKESFDRKRNWYKVNNSTCKGLVYKSTV